MGERQRKYPWRAKGSGAAGDELDELAGLDVAPGTPRWRGAVDRILALLREPPRENADTDTPLHPHLTPEPVSVPNPPKTTTFGGRSWLRLKAALFPPPQRAEWPLCTKCQTHIRCRQIGGTPAQAVIWLNREPYHDGCCAPGVKSEPPAVDYTGPVPDRPGFTGRVPIIGGGWNASGGGGRITPVPKREWRPFR